MTLKNEIFEGIAAYKALTPSKQDDYYDYRLQQLKQKQKDDDAVKAGGQAEIDAANKRRAGGPPAPTTPTVASTAMPGSPQTAMNTSSWDPTQPVSQANLPVDRRGGMIRAFRPGGPVTPTYPTDQTDQTDDDEPDEDDDDELLPSQPGQDQPTVAKYADGGSSREPDQSEVDRIVTQVLSDDRSLAVPQRTPEQREEAIWGKDTTARANAARDAAIADVRARRAVQPTPGEDRAVAPDWPPPDDRAPPQGPDMSQSTPGFDGAVPYAPTGNTTLGQAATATRNAILPPTSTPPPPGAAPPAPPPPAPPAAPAPPVGAGAGVAPGGTQVAAAAPPAAPNFGPSLGVPPAALQTTPPPPPPAARPSGPTGSATSPAPPPGNATGNANSPTTAPKGSLRDPNRVTAFDPTADVNDPDNAHRVDQSGRVVQPTQQDMHEVLRAGMTAAPGGGAQQPQPGEGAVSRPVFNQFVAAHNPGGRLTPGQALMVGMVGKYKVLLSQGRQAEASQMAWGLMQAANLEAASWGDVAHDQLRANNLPGAVNSIAKAADLQPDGMHHRPSADGRSIETYDNSGRLTASTPIDGRTALAAAMGLQDGTMMWQALQQTVASMQKPDRNAEGRQLTNELRRQQIEGAKLRNKKLASAGTGGGGSSSAAQELAALFHQTGATQPTGTTRGQGGGEDDSWIDREPADPREEPD